MTLNVTGSDTQKGNTARLYISNLDTQGNNKPGRIKIYDNETLIDTVYIDNTPELKIINYPFHWTWGVQQQIVGSITYDMQTVPGTIFVFKDNVQIGTAQILNGRFEFDYTPLTSQNHTLEFRYNGSGDVGHATTTYEITDIIATTTKYGLNTENPWTTNNVLEAIWPTQCPGAIASNYKKQNPGTTINIPLTGDFEIELKLNLNERAGTGWFGLYDSNTKTNVLTVDISNTLNGTAINDVFPNCDWDYTGNIMETVILRRIGTTYTYQHGNEIKTLTINNTNPLYFKMVKRGNADMYLTTMGVTGGGAVTRTELDCTNDITDWIAIKTIPAIKTLGNSVCLMIQCNVYDHTLADYKFDITKNYDVHTELHLNNKSNGYVGLGFYDHGETRDENNIHIVEWTNENGFKWSKMTRINGIDTVMDVAFQGKQIKYDEWIDVDFKIRCGKIYATFKTPSTQTISDVETFIVNETVQDVFVGEMDYDFWFGIRSWISRTQGMGCRKFVVKEL